MKEPNTNITKFHHFEKIQIRRITNDSNVFFAESPSQSRERYREERCLPFPLSTTKVKKKKKGCANKSPFLPMHAVVERERYIFPGLKDLTTFSQKVAATSIEVERTSA